MSTVMIQPATYEDVQKAIDRAFEIFPLNLKSKKILIKPNVLRASEANEAIVTNPAVLATVVKRVESMEPASIIVGDNPGIFSYGANEESFRFCILIKFHVMSVSFFSLSSGKYILIPCRTKSKKGRLPLRS